MLITGSTRSMKICNNMGKLKLARCPYLYLMVIRLSQSLLEESSRGKGMQACLSLYDSMYRINAWEFCYGIIIPFVNISIWHEGVVASHEL